MRGVLAGLLVSLLLVAAGIGGALASSGVLLLACAAAAVLGGFLAVARVVALVPGLAGGVRGRPWIAQGILLIVSTAVVLMAAEAALYVAERQSAGPPPGASPGSPAGPGAAEAAPAPARVFFPDLPAEVRAARSRSQAALVQPAEWAKRDVPVPGTMWASYHFGVLEVFDENKMRRTTPFPPKSPGTFRVMVVGDSMTYGRGVEAGWTYPALLERWLAPRYRVEVLNLGVSGYQSEDVLGVVRRFLPRLRPDLVLYGVCLNDFLPSRVSQYDRTEAYALPLPESLKSFFADRTRVGRFAAFGYDAALRRFHRRFDFYDDILSNFGRYQDRFGRDVAEMNAVVTGQGLPPVVAMVLDPKPVRGGRGQQIARVAERLMTAAGMSVIGTERYYEALDGRDLTLNRWDGHPDEEAHAIFAGMIREWLEARGELGGVRKPAV